MIEHVSLRCKDVKRSRALYERALAPLGYTATQVYPGAVGFMADGHTSFWVTKGIVATPSHIAFRARSRKAVEAFHRTALGAGALRAARGIQAIGGGGGGGFSRKKATPMTPTLRSLCVREA